MIEIFANLFIGGEEDYESTVKHQSSWKVVQACKFPYHRAALGYTTQGAPKEHPEYYYAYRENRLILNLIDAPDPSFIPRCIIDEALKFIHDALTADSRVLVHCNKGESRSAGIGLLYLVTFTNVLPKNNLFEAEAAYRAIYPRYNPASGMRGFIAKNWEAYSP